MRELIEREKKLPHRELLRVLHYDPTTGFFWWRVRLQLCADNKGKRAGGIDAHGDLVIKYRTVAYYARRLAWFYINKTWHSAIYVKNGNKLDLRIANLRAVMKTPRAAKSVASTHFGVVKYGPTGEWVAFTRYKGEVKFFGSHEGEEEAIIAQERGEIDIRVAWKDTPSKQEGVRWDKTTHLWVAIFRIFRRVFPLGEYLKLEDAVEARWRVERSKVIFSTKFVKM